MGTFNILNNRLFFLLSQHGALHRKEAKNYAHELSFLLKNKFVQKIRFGRFVYYQLTSKALPLLDDYRNHLLYLARLQSRLNPRSKVYSALVGDLRFLNTEKKEAKDFLFLGDWQLLRQPSVLQLEWAQQHYFSEQQKGTLTVDFNENNKKEVYKGNYLTVYSVTETELIKLKLERYRKQDPLDIDAIIKKINLDFLSYKEIALEASKDFVGNRKIFILSALLVAENHYSADQVNELQEALNV